MTDELQKGRHALIGLGRIFKWFFNTIGAGVRFLAPVVDSIVYVFGEFAQVLNTVNSYLGKNYASLALMVAGLLGFLSIAKTTCTDIKLDFVDPLPPRNQYSVPSPAFSFLCIS